MHTEEMIRRTSLNLDFDLVDQAKAVLGTTETTETIHRALADVVHLDHRRKLAVHRFDLSDDELHALRTWRTAGKGDTGGRAR